MTKNPASAGFFFAALQAQHATRAAANKRSRQDTPHQRSASPPCTASPRRHPLAMSTTSRADPACAQCVAYAAVGAPDCYGQAHTPTRLHPDRRRHHLARRLRRNRCNACVRAGSCVQAASVGGCSPTSNTAATCTSAAWPNGLKWKAACSRPCSTACPPICGSIRRP
ncbi:hypothetical protein XOCgx_0039 [Xanthomonas oryzae pv. oryzicola]|nr:hypothetical protein XOCgx_0039 [Xanthomonas oryzae pv. oryzicola]